MTPAERDNAFRELAVGLQGVDLPVYAAYGVDPLEPTMGEGDPRCRVAIFGRDPGRHEIQHRRPFVGVGGQKIRKGLYRTLYGEELPDFDASIKVGERVFWANTVPYKPLGNKAWSVKIKKRFQPLINDLLVHGWQGQDVLCMGRVAFFWFAMGDRDQNRRLKEFWAREDRFEASINSVLTAPDGTRKEFRLHPVPHPSPLNATWAPHFDRLLALRLAQIGWGHESWRR